MSTNILSYRSYELFSRFFGDETLAFHSSRLQHFLTSAFEETDEDTQPNIPRLLHIQNDLLRLLDAAYFLYLQTSKLQLVMATNDLEDFTKIRAAIPDPKDFPAHLHSTEWSQPEAVLEEFFELQSIDEWKDVVMALLQSAIGEGSPSALLSDLQCGFAMLMLHKLLDAVWLMWITGQVKEEAESGDELFESSSLRHDQLDFFFIDCNGKFKRVDMAEITEVRILQHQMTIYLTEDGYDIRMNPERMDELTKRLVERGVLDADAGRYNP